jgi:hypothetical protein
MLFSTCEMEAFSTCSVKEKLYVWASEGETDKSGNIQGPTPNCSARSVTDFRGEGVTVIVCCKQVEVTSVEGANARSV